MLFSVIYSVDVPADTDVLTYAPPHVDELWDETEGDSQYDLSYLEGEWENGSHRKWCAVLDREQFDEFVAHCGLVADSTETLGSIGAPGLGFGVSPAISFESGNPDALQNAYVTPLPEVRKKHATKRDWKRVKRAVLAMYG
jgi:hypothetical protein